jgi:hypothetical protein
MGGRKVRIDRAKMRSPGRPPVLHQAQRRPFLAGGRQRALERGSSSNRRRIAGGRYQMVPGVWRYAPIASFAVIARGDRTLFVAD